MKVRILLFAAYAEAAGWSERDVDAAEGQCAEDLWRAVEEDMDQPGRRRPLCAVNRHHASLDRELREGDEVAFFPPVSGGESEAPLRPDPAALIGGEPLDPRAMEARVRTDACGAVCTFVGVVRDHHEGRAVEAVSYEAYPEMAGEELHRICSEAEERWPGTRALARHRTGRLEVGEASVAIVVAAPHRAEAFEACRHVIEEIKRRLPVWKKDHFSGGGTTWRDP